MKKIILFLIILTSIAEGCKYEDGPLISLRSAKNRLYGAYTLTAYTVNDEDSLSLYYDSLSKSFSFFYEDINYYDACFITGQRKDGFISALYWNWSLINNNKTLKINEAWGANGTGPFGNNKTPELKIIRLTNKEIKMKTNYNNKEYYMELK